MNHNTKHPLHALPPKRYGRQYADHVMKDTVRHLQGPLYNPILLDMIKAVA